MVQEPHWLPEVQLVLAGVPAAPKLLAGKSQVLPGLLIDKLLERGAPGKFGDFLPGIPHWGHDQTPILRAHHHCA